MAIICSYAIYLIIVPGFLEVPSLHCFRNRLLGLLLSRMHSPDSAVDFMAESHRNLKKYIKKFKPDVVGLTSQCSDITNLLD